MYLSIYARYVTLIYTHVYMGLIFSRKREMLTCRMSRNRKYVLATSWNCSNKLTGRKVMMLYLEVTMQLLWSKQTG